MSSAVDSLVVRAAHDEAKEFRTEPVPGMRSWQNPQHRNLGSYAAMQHELVAPDLSNVRPLSGCQTCGR
jgi:hypothetical protein